MKLASMLVLLAGCGAPSTTPAGTSQSVVTIEAAPPPAASIVASTSAKRVEVSDAAIRTRMPELGVTIVLPPGVEAAFDHANKYYVFQVSYQEQGSVDVVGSPAPGSEQAAMTLWKADLLGDEARLVEHGGGGLEPWWSVMTFKVRVGVEGHPGLHRIKRVSRVGGVLGLAGGRHARCSVAIEYDVEGNPRAPSLNRAIGICKSLRPL